VGTGIEFDVLGVAVVGDEKKLVSAGIPSFSERRKKNHLPGRWKGNSFKKVDDRGNVPLGGIQKKRGLPLCNPTHL